MTAQHVTTPPLEEIWAQFSLFTATSHAVVRVSLSAFTSSPGLALWEEAPRLGLTRSSCPPGLISFAFLSTEWVYVCPHFLVLPIVCYVAKRRGLKMAPQCLPVVS